MSFGRMMTGLIVGSGACLVAACGASDGPAAGQSQPAAKEAQFGTLLAAVTVAEGHTVEFRELISGTLITSEDVPQGAPQFLQDSDGGKALSEIYHRLVPSGAVPQTIVDAEARDVVRKANMMKQPASVAVPPEQVESHGTGPALYDANDQAWFKQTYCGANTQVCVQGSDWASTAWRNSSQFVGMGGREGTPMTIWVHEWDCSSFLGINTGCQDNLNYQHDIAPGYAWIVNYGDTSHQRRADLNYANAHGTVSLAQKDPPRDPPGCGLKQVGLSAPCCTVTVPACQGGWVCRESGNSGQNFCYAP